MELVIRDVPYELGRAAQRRGVRRESCPYPAFMDSAVCWLKGWDSVATDSHGPVGDDARTWHGIPVQLREAFTKLCNAATPALEMSRQLGLPVDQVNACLKSLDLEKRPIRWLKADTGWLPDECARLDALWSAGVPLPKIGRELGRRKSDLGKRLSEMMRSFWSQKERAQLKDLMGQNLTVPEMALQLDRTSKSVEAQMRLLERFALQPHHSTGRGAVSSREIQGSDVDAPARPYHPREAAHAR